MNETAEDKKREAILARIRALLAKTIANGCTEAEAASAASTVDKLMADYEIDLTETLVGDQEITKLDIALNHHPVRFAAAKLAAFTDCKVWYDDKEGAQNLCFFGLDVDVSVAEYLLLLFQRAIDRATTQFTVFNEDYALADSRLQKQMAHSFGVGMAKRLGERLAELKSKRDFSQKAKGFDLVVSKKALVDAGFATLGINLTSGDRYGRSVRHDGSYAAGQAAANTVSINQGVGGRGAGRIK